MAAVAEIKTQPVRFWKISALSRVINLRNIFYPKSFSQKDWLKDTRQIYQMEFVVITVEYVWKIEVSMPEISFVKFFYEYCWLGDKISSQFQIFDRSRAVKVNGQFLL